MHLHFHGGLQTEHDRRKIRVVVAGVVSTCVVFAWRLHRGRPLPEELHLRWTEAGRGGLCVHHNRDLILEPQRRTDYLRKGKGKPNLFKLQQCPFSISSSHRRTGPVSFSWELAGVSCPNIFSSPCPKLSGFARILLDFFLPENCNFKNSIGG